MICICRDFVLGVGVIVVVVSIGFVILVIFVIENELKKICYVMVYDEIFCIGCIVCMDVCWIINKVLEGVLCLEIICSEFYGEFLNVEYEFFC